ncbi:linear amide C-N hydrolase [Labrenzia sp. 011]|nr:linear amide C-N hydrolase [Labrenzia sp. 011]
MSLLWANTAAACTSLLYTDSKGKVYYGRTMELQMELPYHVVHFPKGTSFSSNAGEGHPPLKYESSHAILSITVPDVAPDGKEKPKLGDMKVVEGINDAGLTFSLLAYPSAEGPQKQVEMTKSILDVMDLGTWMLAQFETVAEVKSAIVKQPVVMEPVKVLKGALPPFHFVAHDKTGASIVLEFTDGKGAVHDNPVGVMTNGPEFQWHLTNLSNYSFLSNVDKESGSFNGFKVAQPDSGIATQGLPSSDTSVGRFVKAAYYSTYAQKVDDPDLAVKTTGHIMNNFDRPKNISVSNAGEGSALSSGLGADPNSTSTEYTSWTTLADLDRGYYFIRTYEGINYSKFDTKKLFKQTVPLIMPLKTLDEVTDYDLTQKLIDSKVQ